MFRPPRADCPRSVRLDFPGWLEDELLRSLGRESRTGDGVFSGAARRCICAPNIARGGREAARAALAEDGIASEPHPLAATALEVTANARGIRHSRAYLSGVVEIAGRPRRRPWSRKSVRPQGRGRALDYCAGGGGKALALAATTKGTARVARRQ